LELGHYRILATHRRYQEAEKYCRIAIEINPERHNAYKNLGISAQGQGRYAEAARNFTHAAKLCPTDCRALNHLKALVAGHREVLEEIPDLAEKLIECHETVQGAEGGVRLQ
jgi:tetratricopeptide (TPR) repeat protein